MHKYLSTPSTTTKQKNRKKLMAALESELASCKDTMKTLKLSLNPHTTSPKTTKKLTRRKSFFSDSIKPKNLKLKLKKTTPQLNTKIKDKKAFPAIKFKGKRPYKKSPLSKCSYPK